VTCGDMVVARAYAVTTRLGASAIFICRPRQSLPTTEA
jgi:hypothetical protein